jgi:hypothetical protein
MSWLDFPKKIFIKTIDTSEEVKCGAHKFTNNMELRYIRLCILINGQVPTTEKMQLQLHSESTYSSLILSSNQISLIDIQNVTSRWIGMIRFDFNYYPINTNLYYYIKLITTGYTRNADAYYLGVVYDWPDYTYPNGSVSPANHPIKMEDFGYSS